MSDLAEMLASAKARGYEEGRADEHERCIGMLEDYKDEKFVDTHVVDECINVLKRNVGDINEEET